jgi:hypothetical protein
MQHILNVIETADSVALLSLAEAKALLKIPATDTSNDAVLTMMIEQTSDEIAVLAGRVFVYEKVQETFFDISNGEKRLYFSRWPVQIEDILELTADGVDILPNLWPQPLPPTAPPTAPSTTISGNWILNQIKGYMYKPPSGIWSGNVNAIYSGGYKLPDDAPPALKGVATLVLRDAYWAYLRGAVLTGVRMISHKHARVQYYPQGQTAGSSGSVMSSPATQRAVNDVLAHYIRHWL